MPRGRKPRTWIRIDCEGVLRGSINYLLTLEGQAVWIKMIALSEITGGRAGYIEDNDHKGLPKEYISHELHCATDILDIVLEKMKADGAIEINGTGSIRLVNFDHYQFSEYDRQRQYRQQKKNNSANVKKPYGEFANVFLTDVESQKLIEKFGENGFGERIENLSIGIESKGYKYKSHYATLLSWERKDIKNGAHQQRPGKVPEKYSNDQWGRKPGDPDYGRNPA